MNWLETYEVLLKKLELKTYIDYILLIYFKLNISTPLCKAWIQLFHIWKLRTLSKTLLCQNYKA